MLEDIQGIAQVAIWFLSVILILLILVQGGGGDLASSFGGGGALDSSLGVGAMRKITKITAWLVLIFMVCIILVAKQSSIEGYSDLESQKPKEETMVADPKDKTLPEAIGDETKPKVEKVVPKPDVKPEAKPEVE